MSTLWLVLWLLGCGGASSFARVEHRAAGRRRQQTISWAEIEDQEDLLLAVDVGLRCGFAVFSADQGLLSYHSEHYGTAAELVKSMPELLLSACGGREPACLRHIVFEGEPNLIVDWRSIGPRA